MAPLLLMTLKLRTTDPRVLLDQWAYTGRLILSKEGRTQLALHQKHGGKYRELQRRVERQKRLIDRSLADEKRFESASYKAKSEKLVSKQREHTTTLQDDLQQLEADLEVATFKKTNAVVTEFNEKLMADAQKILDKTSATGSLKVIFRMESRVVEKELRALNVYVPPECARELDIIDHLTARVETAARDFLSKLYVLVDLVIAADPSVKRAYVRLEEALKTAQTLANESSKQEELMEEQIAKLSVEIKVAEERLEEIPHATFLKQKKEHCESARKNLSEALSSQQKRNLTIGQRLFRIEGIVRRLYISKLMITAFPFSAKEQILQFRDVTTRVRKYLHDGSEGDDKVLRNENVIDFPALLNALEKNVQMSFIRIAKESRPRLSPKAIARLSACAASAIDSLNHERDNQIIESDRWEALERRGLIEGQELMSAVGENRHRQCRELLELIERSTSVLSVTVAAVVEREGRPSA